MEGIQTLKTRMKRWANTVYGSLDSIDSLVSVEVVGGFFLLCCMWDRTRWLAAKAAIRESSPANTAPPMMVASFLALDPGGRSGGEGPLTPSIARQPPWAWRVVPPPTVPTSTEGMVTDTCRLSPSSAKSITVMQLEDSTFWAGS